MREWGKKDEKKAEKMDRVVEPAMLSHLKTNVLSSVQKVSFSLPPFFLLSLSPTILTISLSLSLSSVVRQTYEAFESTCIQMWKLLLLLLLS